MRNIAEKRVLSGASVPYFFAVSRLLDQKVAPFLLAVIGS